MTMTEHDTFRERVEAAVPTWQRDLVYVDYRDQLMDDQLEQMIHGEWPDDDWASESRWISANELADQLISDGEFTDDERDDLVEAIQELDTSDPFAQLARNTGLVLFRFSPHEDDMAWLDEELDDPDAACEALGLAPEFRDVVAKILPEIAGYRAEGGGWFGASIVFRADAADMIAYGTHVTVKDPFVWLTNPWSGNGYGEVAEGLSITLAKADVHVDRYAWGYGAHDVFGGLLLDDSDITITTEEGT